ncbi:hypothetical protein [Microbacterium lacticum]|uniref:Uncharacterized protein n=1 Tax=Microbacterium lacticum TaxID=33885 RepID=A0A4Y3UPY9_9MICO|nr:hypothetical protein [Microbacterium lacticum]TQN00734.1 hypothetical protein FHX68_0852 [Microbacterium lacticum]GEB96433.1 hypothetical protein MLA01_26520 [Microbacterium lacticum]GGN13896.1 hypothetical protein GCM10009724_04160 [Microbacterium lacticum]
MTGPALIRCTRCRRELPEDAYGNHAGRREGRNNECKDCARTRRLAYRHTDVGRAKHNAANKRARERRSAA